ncbi:hypothetical protein LshimejAT787_0207790 [Lyophyllum shimeji]|uniref:Uncharacterized protein n=1 Tax=Lyophyllum shimeji TaxID=47721 RepID=A0A9P3UIB3_LYOSH|nr:hypothetical protein LshimejAT787_0207790 [Lyophyllum shimeji]
MATPNSLGLDFEQLTVKDQQQDSSKPEAAQEKKKPYVNTERVKTGGSQRDKLSEEALTERMARMREQNEKIKQRRLDVQADEEAFRKTQESERAKLAQNRKVQANIDRTREQNAQRKMDKIQSREWDSGKPTGDWKSNPNQEATSQPSDNDKNAEGTGSVDAASPLATPVIGREEILGEARREPEAGGGVEEGRRRQLQLYRTITSPQKYRHRLRSPTLQRQRRRHHNQFFIIAALA